MQYVCLCCLNTPMLHTSNYTINTKLVVWNVWLLSNNRKVHHGLILSVKFYFEKKNELISLFTHLKIQFFIKLFSSLLNP